METKSPSATAKLIATGTFVLAHDKRYSYLIPERAGEVSAMFIEQFSRFGRLTPGMLKHPSAQLLLQGTISLVKPYIFLHYALRKRFIEEQVRDELARGTDQVLILGAGFDTLATRLHREFPEVQFLELDSVATQDIKRNVLKMYGLLGPNLTLRAVDFETPSSLAVLRRALRLEHRRMLVIAEGLFMYLTEDRVHSILNELSSHATAPTSLLFSALTPGPSAKLSRRTSGALTNLWLQWSGEQFRWAIERGDLEHFLTERGLSASVVTSPVDLSSRYLGTNFAKVRHKIPKDELFIMSEVKRFSEAAASTPAKHLGAAA